MTSARLRPIERRVLTLLDEGLDLPEVARRFGRSPGHVERVVGWARLPGRHRVEAGDRLRPIERRILLWRSQGAPHTEIAPRFRRSPSFTARVEDFARYKLTR